MRHVVIASDEYTKCRFLYMHYNKSMSDWARSFTKTVLAKLSAYGRLSTRQQELLEELFIKYKVPDNAKANSKLTDKELLAQVKPLIGMTVGLEQSDIKNYENALRSNPNPINTGISGAKLFSIYKEALNNKKIEWRTEYFAGAGAYNRRRFASGLRGTDCHTGKMLQVLRYSTDPTPKQIKEKSDFEAIHTDKDKCWFLLNHCSVRMSKWDLDFITSIAKQLENTNRLSPKQQMFANKIFTKFNLPLGIVP